MEAMLGEEQLHPITIPEAIESLNKIIVDIVRKNRTMVEYYIYPKPVPSEIEAYKPRLQVLYARLEVLATLDLPNLTLMVDDAAALVSAFLLPIVDQLLNAVHGVQSLFINHYDRKLEQRKPYAAIYHTLEYREKQLKKFQSDQMRNPQRRLPETMKPFPPSTAEAVFCRFGVAFANHRDHGKLGHVLPEDLSKDDKERLRNNGGAFLSWDCPGCAFKMKYHVANSINANILSTDDVRSHIDTPEVEYRPSWLVKCHLYQTKNGSRGDRFDERDIISPTGTRRISTVRRQTDSRRFSNPFSFGPPRRTKSEVITEDYTLPRNRSATTTAKYGCPFCFVVGKEYGHMDYRHGAELAEHIAARHNLGNQPSGLVLEKYMVGLNGKCAENVRRWDLNIKTR